MKYVALLDGGGGGCDYTIACNRDFKFFEAATREEAVAKCRKLWEDHGGSSGEPRVQEIYLLEATASTMEKLPVEQWNADAEKAEEERQRQQEIADLERKLEKARKGK